MNEIAPLARLIEQLQRLPGIGAKGAQQGLGKAERVKRNVSQNYSFNRPNSRARDMPDARRARVCIPRAAGTVCFYDELGMVASGIRPKDASRDRESGFVSG